jgi:hypothetical protein
MTSRTDIKRDVFYRLLDMEGRVFVLVQYSKDVVMGRRGFTEQEEENGIVLVFNKDMRFTWDEGGINASLVFGGVLQKCYIPSRDIIAIYSPDAKVQLTIDPAHDEAEETTAELSTFPSPEAHGHVRPTVHVEKDGKVIKVDFAKHGNEHEEVTDGDDGDEPA